MDTNVTEEYKEIALQELLNIKFPHPYAGQPGDIEAHVAKIVKKMEALKIELEKLGIRLVIQYPVKWSKFPSNPEQPHIPHNS